MKRKQFTFLSFVALVIFISLLRPVCIRPPSGSSREPSPSSSSAAVVFSSRQCTSNTTDADARVFLKRAGITGCHGKEGLYYRMIQFAIPNAHTLVDIGTNKGLVSSMMLGLWRPMLGMNSRSFHQVLSKLPEYKPLAGCGACNECKDDFRAILPLEFRFCHGYSHCLPLHLRSLRLFSFDGNPAYVRLVQEGIRHFPRRPLEVLRLPQEWQNQTLEEIWKVELAAFSDDSTNKTTMFWVNGDELGKIVTKNETNKKLARVPLITIDEWRERDGIDHIDFIKIDTEGHDAKIIKGAKRTLFEKKITAMVFESGHMWPAEDTLEDITRMMEDYGYACYFDYSNGMVKLTHGCWANKYGEASKIWGNTLCVLSTNREGEMITRAFDQWSIQFN